MFIDVSPWDIYAMNYSINIPIASVHVVCGYRWWCELFKPMIIAFMGLMWYWQIEDEQLISGTIAVLNVCHSNIGEKCRSYLSSHRRPVSLMETESDDKQKQQR